MLKINFAAYNNLKPLYIALPVGLTHKANFSILPTRKKGFSEQV